MFKEKFIVIFQPDYLHNSVILFQVLALQARDKTAILMVSTDNKYFFCGIYMKVEFISQRRERDAAYVLGSLLTYRQHGYSDVTRKPAIPECFRVLFII